MVKKRIGHLALASSLLACWPVNSAESQPPAVVAENPPHSDGTISRPCVLLQNDNVLFGQAAQVGEFVVVRTGQQSEVQLPRRDVVCWADSIRNLYRYRVDHRQKGDIAAHLRDARWCLQNDLYDLAANEIRTIKTMVPGNAQAKSVEDQLQRLTSRRTAAYSRPIAAASPVQPAGFFKNDGLESEGPELGLVDLATLRRFASHVQPMLLNRCGRCHARGSNRRWTLNVPAARARASSRTTRENLAASLQYVSRNAQEESELLIKATTPHGGGPAPLDPRSAKAIQSLKIWLSAARTGLPKSDADHQDVPDHNASSRQAPTPTPLIAEREVVIDDISQPQGELDGQPSRLPKVANPFDPDLFNRRFHPDSNSE